MWSCYWGIHLNFDCLETNAMISRVGSLMVVLF